MNILVLSWRDLKHPLAGGAEQVMHEHMKGWVNDGNKVTVFSSHPKSTSKLETIEGIKIIRKGSQYLTVHLIACLWFIFGKHEKFDLVVDQFHGWPFFTPFYIKAPKLAVVQELTKKVWFRYPLPYRLNFILGTLGYILEPLFFIPYKNVKFMTGSESAKAELQTVGIKIDNITSIPHGVIVNSPKKRFKKEKINTIIFLGALASDKGIEDAIEAFAKLSAIGSYQFWIVGKGEKKYLKYLKSKTSKLSIRSKTNFFGYVTQEKKFELLARAHLMINPSIREGWGLVNIEANAVGTPVVAYSSQGLVDSVKNNYSGVLCHNNTPWVLAKEISQLLDDKKRYLKLQKTSLLWSKKFSWEKSRIKSLELIKEICNNAK